MMNLYHYFAKRCMAVLSSTGQLSFLPSVGQEMSTSQSATMLCGCGVNVGMALSSWGYTWLRHVKLHDPSLTCVILKCLRCKLLMILTKVLFTLTLGGAYNRGRVPSGCPWHKASRVMRHWWSTMTVQEER